jgi:hypothetical protein
MAKAKIFGANGRMIPGNQQWLHAPANKAKLDQAIA